MTQEQIVAVSRVCLKAKFVKKKKETMGHYLSEPKTEKVSESGAADPSTNLNLSYSAVSMQGWRRTMEDALKVDLQLS